MSDSKRYRAEVSSTSDYSDIPAVVEFSIDKPAAMEIIRLADIVKGHDLYKVEKFDWRATYLKHDREDTSVEAEDGKENEISTDAATLNVSDTHFWFSAFLRHTNVEITCEQQCVGDLAKHFGLAPTDGSGRKPVCPRCGSDNVVADAAARWDTETHAWDVSNVFDKGHGCDDCGAADIEFKWVQTDC